MSAGRVDPEEYGELDLRAHSLLAGVPLHDVWAVDLPGGGPEQTILDLREILSLEKVAEENRAVRVLFSLRAALGRVFRWDRERPAARESSFLQQLTDADRENSLVARGTPEGPFRVLYVFPREAVSEIRNATVHAFSIFALAQAAGGLRLYWAIYVRPVGRGTAWYMRLIDPFRRFIVYPAVLRHIQKEWARRGAPE